MTSARASTSLLHAARALITTIGTMLAPRAIPGLENGEAPCTLSARVPCYIPTVTLTPAETGLPGRPDSPERCLVRTEYRMPPEAFRWKWFGQNVSPIHQSADLDQVLAHLFLQAGERYRM